MLNVVYHPNWDKWGKGYCISIVTKETTSNDSSHQLCTHLYAFGSPEDTNLELSLEMSKVGVTK